MSHRSAVYIFCVFHSMGLCYMYSVHNGWYSSITEFVTQITRKRNLKGNMKLHFLFQFVYLISYVFIYFDCANEIE